MIDKTNLPKHIAIIMDGNGRWAKEKGLPRIAGHREGIERVREAVKAAGEFGIEVITFYAFSSENWSRPKKEVDALMRFLDKFLDQEIPKLNKKNIRFRVIGRDSPIPGNILRKIRNGETLTKNNTGPVMVLALNYGSRQEIIDGFKKFNAACLAGDADMQDLAPETFNSYLYTAGLPDPDLLIRTSGEVRLSNFLLWQLSYAELYFAKKYWPDFHHQDLEAAIKEYQKRQRRFGGLDAVKKDN